jgi:hypothetical protein
MKSKAVLLNVLPLLIAVLAYFGCEQGSYTTENNNYKGYVIGMEMCHTDETQDYWLIDFTYLPDSRQIGDTLVLNGTIYTNVVKTRGLYQELKEVGMKVSIDAQSITQNKILTTNCNVSNPVTYILREMFILNQGEIRG